MPFRGHLNYRHNWSPQGFVIAGVVMLGMQQLQPAFKALLLYFFGAK